MNAKEQLIKENLPCYIYDEAEIILQCRKLRTALPAFNFLYSIKVNPFEPVIECIVKEGFGADAASAREVELSLKNGIARQDIFYSAPGKTKNDIIKCFDTCILIADSFSEIRMIDEVAKSRSQSIQIGIRLNPDFTMDTDYGISSEFGIGIEQMTELRQVLKNCGNITVSGIHIHVKSQELDVKKLVAYYQKCFDLAKRINEYENIMIEFINFGSGIGTLYDMTKDVPVDLDQLSAAMNLIVTENANTINARMYIETGRFLVCNAGTYYTDIVDIKQSYEKKYLIVRNGMNGFLRPAIANLIQNVTDDKDIMGQEPLYTSKNAFEVRIVNDSDQKERVTVVGNLCTGLDVIKKEIELNKAVVGDVVSISNAGSYAFTLSPLFFSSHPLPAQFLLSVEQEMK